MSTTRTFQDMLNEYLPNDLLKEEFVKRDYLLSKVDKDDNWKGGTLIVPFKAGAASSVAFGSLTADTDIAEDKYVRGEVSGHKEVWGSMIFNHRDLMEHDAISEQNFLKILPGAIDDFLSYMKNVVSVNLLNGAHFAKLTSDATANDGLIIVDRPDRFQINQKVIVDDDNTADQTGYVSTIDMNTRTILLVTARGGATPVDFSAAQMTVAQNAKCYNDGAKSNSFSSLRDALLSSANGGSSTLYGQTKASYPYLQGINVNGSDMTATNFMEKIFDKLVTIRQFGKGNPSDVVMSYTNLGYCMKIVEQSKGAFNVVPNSTKTGQYGWMELEIGSVTKGAVKLIGVQEADDDVVIFIDWRALKFHSNGFFKKRTAPDGKQYFEKRATTGYQYILDVCLYGELVVNRPSYCGIIHSIDI